jgi:cell division ATPase FtsA
MMATIITIEAVAGVIGEVIEEAEVEAEAAVEAVVVAAEAVAATEAQPKRKKLPHTRGNSLKTEPSTSML